MNRRVRSTLVATPHLMPGGGTVIEIWFGGQLVGTVVGAEGPGVRVISKHNMTVTTDETPPVAITVKMNV